MLFLLVLENGVKKSISDGLGQSAWMQLGI